jgi:hypothetical protein
LPLHPHLLRWVYGTSVGTHHDLAASSWQNLTTKLVLRFEYLQPTAALAFGLMVKKRLFVFCWFQPSVGPCQLLTIVLTSKATQYDIEKDASFEALVGPR